MLIYYKRLWSVAIVLYVATVNKIMFLVKGNSAGEVRTRFSEWFSWMTSLKKSI